jgi:proteic killer suppression protein
MDAGRCGPGRRFAPPAGQPAICAARRATGDLRRPPGNRLEKLSGDRAGQHSIRINDQWRICFVWDDGPSNVEITDYHD